MSETALIWFVLRSSDGELSKYEQQLKLTGCETTTSRVIEHPASRYGERDGRDT